MSLKAQLPSRRAEWHRDMLQNTPSLAAIAGANGMTWRTVGLERELNKLMADTTEFRHVEYTTLGIALWF
jgi:hypothetical protein